MDLSDLAYRPKTVRCLKCKRRIKVKPMGRLPTFCSPSCRQTTFKRRHRPPRLPAPIDDQHRQVLWDTLCSWGVVSGEMPPMPKQDAQHEA
jgi:hypothetical protein